MKEDIKDKQLPFNLMDLVKFATRPSTVQRDEFVKKLFGKPSKGRILSILEGKNLRSYFVHKEDINLILDNITKTEFSSEESFIRHIKEYEEIISCLNKIANPSSKFKSCSLNKCAEEYEMCINTFERFSKFILAPFAIETRLDPECRELLAKEFPDKVVEYMGIIGTPTQLNAYQKMRKEMIKIFLNKKKDVSKLVSKYYWYSEYSYVEKLLDDSYFISEIEKFNLDFAKKELNDIENIKENKRSWNSLMLKLKNDRLMLLAKIIHEYTFLRTDRLDQLKRVQSRIRSIFERIALEISFRTHKKWDIKMVSNFLNEEIISFLRQGKIPNYDEIRIRVNHKYIYYSKEGHSNIIYNQDKIKEYTQKINNLEKENLELKGMIAYPGKIKGKIVLVLNKSDLSKVNKKSIIVAKTTMPDYTPTMKIAKGFVTDEGGITCHAAIISREMKKPCITGTKNATQVLKDGDYVEVDADKGVVRKI